MHPDALWTPWRAAYIRDLESRAERARRAGPAEDGNFLLRYWSNPAADEANHVVLRDEAGMILLNRYPYANGHLLVALGEPRPTLLDYDAAQRAWLWALVDRAVGLVERVLHPQGVNVGFNQGRAAGAGLPEHLHAHVVPRWEGDVNFFSAFAGVRVVPDDLDGMAKRLRAAAARE